MVKMVSFMSCIFHHNFLSNFVNGKEAWGARNLLYLNVSAAYLNSQTRKNSSLKVCEFTGCTLYLKFF